MPLTREQAARALGMKTREIREITRADGGYEVTTHDGQRTLVGRDGALLPAGGPVAGTAEEQAAGSARREPPAKSALKPEWVEHAVASGMDRASAAAMSKAELVAKTGGASEPEQEPSPVPDGTPEEVLAWVDGDKERAAAAHDVEMDREQPRAELAAALEELAA